MSSNRLMYDACSTKQQVQGNGTIFEHQMYTGKYNNCKPCRIILGQVGGNNVSVTPGNMVDLESDLMGITRPLTDCSNGRYKPNCDCKNCTTGLPCGCPDCKSKMIDLPACQMVRYGPVVESPPFKDEGCDMGIRQDLTQGRPGFFDRIMNWF